MECVNFDLSDRGCAVEVAESEMGFLLSASATVKKSE